MQTLNHLSKQRPFPTACATCIDPQSVKMGLIWSFSSSLMLIAISLPCLHPC